MCIRDRFKGVWKVTCRGKLHHFLAHTLKNNMHLITSTIEETSLPDIFSWGGSSTDLLNTERSIITWTQCGQLWGSMLIPPVCWTTCTHPSSPLSHSGTICGQNSIPKVWERFQHSFVGNFFQVNREFKCSFHILNIISSNYTNGYTEIPILKEVGCRIFCAM